MFQKLNQAVTKFLVRTSVVFVAGVFGVSALAGSLFLVTPSTYAAGETWTCSVVDASSAITSASKSKTPPPLIGGKLLPGHGIAADKTFLTTLRENIAGKLINTLIGWTAALAVVFLVIGGYQYLTALGEAEQIKKAHKTITWSMLGLALALLSFALVQVITSVSFGNDLKSAAGSNPSVNASFGYLSTSASGVWVCE